MAGPISASCPTLKRPFIVEAAEHRIVATRCNFDVRCEDGQVQVVLIHGEADVKPASAPDGQGERLQAGERLVASNDIEKRDKPDLTHVLAWQTGYEMFDKEDLAQAAEEMNRYSTAQAGGGPQRGRAEGQRACTGWATMAPLPAPWPSCCPSRCGRMATL